MTHQTVRVRTGPPLIEDQLPEGARTRVTMAVGIAEAAGGGQTTVIGTSEPRGYLRPGVTLNEGEVVAPGRGHAEADIAPGPSTANRRY